MDAILRFTKIVSQIKTLSWDNESVIVSKERDAEAYFAPESFKRKNNPPKIKKGIVDGWYKKKAFLYHGIRIDKNLHSKDWIPYWIIC